MTRQEVTGVRDLGFSNWIRKELPDSSTGFSASDLDFMLWNWKTKKIILLESFYAQVDFTNSEHNTKMIYQK